MLGGGAASVNLHPRRTRDGTESLAADTQKDIDVGNAADRSEAVRAWRDPPDVVSLNLAEAGTIELGHVLLESGIGIEAGVFTISDADTLLRASWAERVHRVLVEVIFEQDDAHAVSLAHAIDERVAGLGRPRLWHGDARANWAVVDAGIAMGMDVRVRLEDTLFDGDGTPAPSNAEQVAQIAALLS